jgi:hypothetical protein
LLSEFKLIWVVQSSSKKYFVSQADQNICTTRAIPRS